MLNQRGEALAARLMTPAARGVPDVADFVLSMQADVVNVALPGVFAIHVFGEFPNLRLRLWAIGG